MSCGVFPNRRTKPRLEWRIASETARFAAFVASRPWTSTPMPISVMQRMRGIGVILFKLAQRRSSPSFRQTVIPVEEVLTARGVQPRRCTPARRGPDLFENALARLPINSLSDGHNANHWMTITRQNNLFTRLGAPDEFGELGLGYGDRYLHAGDFGEGLA